MPQALQLITNKPQTSDFGAGASTAQDTESGENRGFSSVLDDKVSESREAARPPETKTAAKPAVQTGTGNKESELQGTAAGGNPLPQKKADAIDDVSPVDTAATVLTDAAINTDEADLLQLAVDIGSAADESQLQAGPGGETADTVPEIPGTEALTDTDDTIAAQTALATPVIEHTPAALTPAPAVVSGQKPASETAVSAGTVQSSQVAGFTAVRSQADSSRQSPGEGHESEADILLQPGSDEETLSTKQQPGEFATKLRGLIDQVKRALGVSQNTTQATGSSELNSPSTSWVGTTSLTATAQQAGDISSAQNTASTSINIGLKQEGWDEAMGQRIQWLVSKGIQKADIRLNPPNLGPLEVRINMTDDGADVRFISQHGVVRDAVESAMPRLREMLAEQGINLANVDVSGHSVAHGNTQQQGEQQGTGSQGHGLASDEDAGRDENTPAIAGRVSQGMLDLFA